MLPAVGSPVFAAPQRKPVQSGEIDAALLAKVSAREIPGIVAMAANEASVVYARAFGLRNMATTTSMSTDTIFRIASMVKLLTSVAALQLVERGKLKLDEPAGNIDPRLPRNKSSPASTPRARRSCAPQTSRSHLRNLLTHTSGLSYPLWDTNVMRYLKAARGKADLPRMPLMFEPGARWAYGGSIDRVGRMVEIASGQTLERYFRDHITGPLAMNDTGPTITEKQRARQASLHRRGADGKLVPQPFEKLNVPTNFSGGGGIYSTAPDYLTLLQALLNGGSLRGASILRPETVALMGRNQIGNIEAGDPQDRESGPVERRGLFPGRSSAMGAGTHDQCRSGA